MKTRQEIEERIAQHDRDLEMWQEPDGFLLPTEPDPEQREIVRRELKAGILVLRWVIE